MSLRTLKHDWRMLVKCICTNCSGHLEFEEENAGEKIKCPHCGWDTTLFDSNAVDAEDDAGSGGLRGKLRTHSRLLLAVAVAAVILAGAGFAVYRWVFPWLQDTFPSVEGNLISSLVCLAGLWVFLAAVAWTLFPVVAYFQLRSIAASIGQLAVNSRPAPPQEEEEKAVVKVEPAEPETVEESQGES